MIRTVVGLAELRGDAICPVDVLMGFDEGIEAPKICEWRLIVDVLEGALVTLVADGTLTEMMDAWVTIVGGEDRELVGSISVGVVG